MAATVARVNDTSRPLADRRAELAALAAAGDARSVEALMAVGDSGGYLSFAAVDALGSVAGSDQRPGIATYLGEKLAARDLKVLAAAIDGYAALMGKDAVPELAEVVRRNRIRGDGFEEMVLTAAVDALGRIASAEAAPVLIEELGRSTGRGWSLEYGSRVVEALGGLDTPEGRQALLAYAAALEARRPDDPLAGPHFDEKIAEARRAAGQ